MIRRVARANAGAQTRRTAKGRTMLKICQFGAGRIGKIHADNIARNPRTRLVTVVDVHRESAEALAKQHGAAVGDGLAALDGADAVLIASSTDTHADLIEAAAKAGKAIFCEKPIDLDSARVDALPRHRRGRPGVPMALGFNRRFDPSFEAPHDGSPSGRDRQGRAGRITSRDPGPPPADYIEVSGGLFRDMMIHDFDMARWLLGEEPVEVFATASASSTRRSARPGDVDTAMVMLKTACGRSPYPNSRRAVYGYDQRVEVFGGAACCGPRTGRDHGGCAERRRGDARQAAAFLPRALCRGLSAELDHFIDAVSRGEARVGGGRPAPCSSPTPA